MRQTHAIIFALLDRRKRRLFLLVVAPMMTMAVLDLVGVAGIMPFLAVPASLDAATLGTPLGTLQEQLAFEEVDAFLRILGAVVFALVLASIAVRAATFHAVTRFPRPLGVRLGIALLRRYLARPYERFLDQHSADLGKSALREVNQVVVGSIVKILGLEGPASRGPGRRRVGWRGIRPPSC